MNPKPQALAALDMDPETQPIDPFTSDLSEGEITMVTLSVSAPSRLYKIQISAEDEGAIGRLSDLWEVLAKPKDKR